MQERRDAWKLNRVSISCFDQINQLPVIRQTNIEYKNILSRVLEDVLRRIDKTFKSFFNRINKGKAGFPRFKNKKNYDSFSYSRNGFWLRNNKLELSKIGKVKIKLSRQIQGKVKTCTIKREIDKWFAVFSVETLVNPLPKTNKQIGIDAGIENFITLSDGIQIENPRCFEKFQKKLRIAQRRVSRRKKGGNRRRKAVLQLRKIHWKIKNQRNDFHHKLSTNLVKNYDLIAIEKLNISGMSKGLLSKQINDVAWYSFFQMLKYKAENAGKTLIEVSPNYTSQDCSNCGERTKKSLSVRVHHCLKCGLKIHRDENAAINILNSALGQSDLNVTYAVR